MPRRHLLAFASLFFLWATVLAQPAAPKGPAEYDATLHFRIDAVGNDRIAQYLAMVRHLRSVGFQRDPNEDTVGEAEDPRANRMRGTIAAGKVNLLLNDRHVKSVLLLPRGQKPPADKEARVRVDLRLRSGLALERQRLLADQARTVLTTLGYRDAVGYDHLGHTRLLGTIPAERLETLLEDLRRQPAAANQGPPLETIAPIRVILARPDLPPPAARPAPPAVPAGQERIGPDLRAVLQDEMKAAQATRLEVLLAVTPEDRDREWVKTLAGVTVEGRIGSVVTVHGRAQSALDLVALPGVVGVRLPRAGQSQVLNPARKEDVRVLQSSGAARLHALGHRGKGTRIAVVDDDFRGWEELAGKGLPEETTLVDLTAERNRSLEPDAFPRGKGPGSGTRCALAVMAAAPDAELTLIRVDAAAPYMLQIAARAISGDPLHALALEQRLAELTRDRGAINQRRVDLLPERRAVLSEFGDEGEVAERRAAFLKKQAVLDRDERDLNERAKRFVEHYRALQGLRGIRVVASALTWPDGYPADGSSALSRWFDDRPFRAALWFQSAGDTRGQAWTGLFRDADGNGVMEFAPLDTTLPPGTWTPELAFLAWQPVSGAQATDLPAGTRLRLSIQWREAHDPSLWRSGEDAYREPVFQPRLVVLRQADSAGARQPADDMEVVAESVGLPLRLEAGPRSGTYEQVVEFRVAQPGRYAVRIEGRLPENDLPRGTPVLPTAQRQIEIHPRVFVRTLGGPGRAVFADYATNAASLGMPADAHALVTVGAADAAGRPEPFSAAGAPHNMALLTKPDVLEFDAGDGTGVAAAYAAGLVATLRSAGVGLYAWRELAAIQRGGLLRVPADWKRQ
jgi:hypothetical protein